MTKQQIKQMMHESKAIEWFDSENMDWLEYVNVFDRFASLVVVAERAAIEESEKPRQWQGLTDEERKSIREWQRIQEELGPVWAPMMLYLYEAIEAKLKEKNG